MSIKNVKKNAKRLKKNDLKAFLKCLKMSKNYFTSFGLFDSDSTALCSSWSVRGRGI
jgi:hypothetical protein